MTNPITSDSEAQSEAPSVDEIDKILYEYAMWRDNYYQDLAAGALTEKEWIDIRDKVQSEAKAKINRLITEARIDELKQLLGRQWWADDQHHEDEVVPYHHIEAQIKLLSNNLSKGE